MFDQKMELELMTAAWVGRRVYAEPNHREVGIVRYVHKGQLAGLWIALVDWDKRETTAELITHLVITED